MKRFIKNLTIFFAPVYAVFVVIIAIYCISVNIGELKAIEDNVQCQIEDSDIIIGLGYNEQTPYYKLMMANHYEAELIALGTSRVMQFKEEFFKQSFYNCGGAVSGNYSEYVNFLENLDYKPKTVLLGLDAWVFNDEWNKGLITYNEFVEINKTNRDIKAVLKDIVVDWLSGKWTIKDLNIYSKNIGFNGRIRDNGYMQDGSYYYGNIYRSPETQPDYLFMDTKNRISQGIKRFQWGEHIDQNTVQQLEELLIYCEAENINVIGFTAPFAPEIYEEMNKSGNYAYLNEIEPVCQRIFAKYGYEFYDYMDGAKLDVTNEYFVDGFHGGDIVYAYILEDMIKNDSCIIKDVDLEGMERLLENSYSPLVFENPDKKFN